MNLKERARLAGAADAKRFNRNAKLEEARRYLRNIAQQAGADPSDADAVVDLIFQAVLIEVEHD